jgi:hypothetical protein
MWLKRFKIAVIQKDIPRIEALLDEMPPFQGHAEAEEAAYLCKAAENLLRQMQDDTLQARKQLEKHIDFLRSTHTDTPSELDLKS